MRQGHDFVSTLPELPKRHSGVLLEQLNQASLSATFYMRAMGLSLPGEEDGVPTHADVHKHLCTLANHALASYFKAQDVAPENQAANEIWGEEEDELFSITVTGISSRNGDGYTVTVDFNLLYPGAA
jgi:hypothetical protein